MEKYTGSSSSDSDSNSRQILSYKEYLERKRRGDKPPKKGYNLQTSSGGSSESDEPVSRSTPLSRPPEKRSASSARVLEERQSSSTPRPRSTPLSRPPKGRSACTRPPARVQEEGQSSSTPRGSVASHSVARPRSALLSRPPEGRSACTRAPARVQEEGQSSSTPRSVASHSVPRPRSAPSSRPPEGRSACTRAPARVQEEGQSSSTPRSVASHSVPRPRSALLSRPPEGRSACTRAPAPVQEEGQSSSTPRSVASHCVPPPRNMQQEEMPSPAESSDHEDLLREIMAEVVSTKARLTKLESKLREGTSGRSSRPTASSSSRRQDIPLSVRRETRRIYSMLLAEDTTFSGWKIAEGITYKSTENQAVLSRLTKEVAGMNVQFLGEHIAGAAYRYYRTCCQAESMKRRALDQSRSQQCRKRERMSRKLQERKSALMKMSFSNPASKKQWSQVLTMEIMSSEESAVDADEDVLCIRPLPWRTARVVDMLTCLDEKVAMGKSSLARRQRKRRVQTSPSLRPAPESSPSWMVVSASGHDTS